MTRDFNMDLVYWGGNLLVKLRGELDHPAANSFRSKIQPLLEEGKIDNLVINMEGLNFIDSSGIGVILGRYNYLQKKGGKVKVCKLEPQVKKVFDATGLFSIIKEYPSEKDALEN